MDINNRYQLYMICMRILNHFLFFKQCHWRVLKGRPFSFMDMNDFTKYIMIQSFYFFLEDIKITTRFSKISTSVSE